MPAPPPPVDSPAAPRAVGPLGHVIRWRLGAAAVVVFALLGALLATVYSQQQQRVARQLLDDAEQHYRARLRQIDEEWVRQAELLRGQIEFSGVLDGDDLRLAQARLTAFLASMGGQGSFTHVLLLGPGGERLFSYATRSGATLQPARRAPLSWTYSPEDRLLYRTLRGPVRLGRRGNVDLVLFAPADNALLAASAFPSTTLSLHLPGADDVATSYIGSTPHGAASASELRLDGSVRWPDEPGAPELHVVRDVQPVMPVRELVALVLLGGAAGGALGWLVLGRWARGHVRRIEVLSGTAARFAADRQLAPKLDADIDHAIDGASNELHAMGRGLQTLMRGVTAAEAAQRQAQDGLRELNATLEQRVEQRTRELALARDEALAASRAREQFLAAMSHELRTPLAGLLGGLELVELERLPEAERRMLTVARRSGDALRSVIDSVLDYAKLEAGHLALDEQVFRPAEVAQEVVELFSALALRRGLSLTCHCAPEAARPVRGAPVRLRQVLLNLVGNALKFTDRGRVDLRVSAGTGGALRFAVEDTGLGIAPEVQAGLFRPFVQGTPAAGSVQGGTGLGLAISQGLVQAMGGRITVHSEPGQGAVFAFELALPAAEPGPTPAAVADAAATSPPLPDALHGRVLLVDDNPVNRIIASQMLARLSLDVVEREDGEQALQALRDQPFDLVLMDCQMPVLDGPAATRALRAGAAGAQAAQVPVVALTAHALAGDLERCLDAGMNACLTKPYTLAALAATLKPWLAPRDTAVAD